MSTQEEIITIKLCKNMQNKEGKPFKVGNVEKMLGGLTPEKFEAMHTYGVEIAKKVPVTLSASEVQEVFKDKDFQKELGLESEFCNEYWYVRREYEISKYFATRKDIQEEIIEIMIESLKAGVKDEYSEKIFKKDTTVDNVLKYIVDFDKIKEELGL